MTLEFGAPPNPRTYARLIWRRKWWAVVLAAGGLAAGLAISLTQAKQYTAVTQLLVQAQTQSGVLGTTLQPVTPTQVQTMLLLVTSAPVKEVVQHALGSTPPVSASEAAQTNVITVTAVGGNPATAAKIANTYATAFVNQERTVALQTSAAANRQLRFQINNLGKEAALLTGQRNTPQRTALANQQALLQAQLAQSQITRSTTTGGLSVVTPAKPPTAPSSPRPLQEGLLGLAAGLALGLAAAFLRDSIDDALTSKEETEHIAASPVLVAVPMVRSWRKRSKPLVVSITSPASPAAEAYRSLRTSLQFTRQDRELRTVLVTSPAAAEGKTSTIVNLGAVFAQIGLRVVLVSCDLRKPRLGQFFGVDEARGLTTVVLGEQTLADSLQAVPGHDNLWVLPTGQLPPNPAELLGGQRVREIIAGLRDQFDLVLIDSPPLLPVTDAVVLSKETDATLLIVASGQTTRGDLRRAIEKLAQVEAPIVGVILNEVNRQAGGRYTASYGYTYGAYRANPDRMLKVPVQPDGNGSAPHRGNGSAKPPRSTAAPVSSSPASGGPASGGPASGGPVSGGPVSGGPVSGGPVSTVPAPAGEPTVAAPATAQAHAPAQPPRLAPAQDQPQLQAPAQRNGTSRHHDQPPLPEPAPPPQAVPPPRPRRRPNAVAPAKRGRNSTAPAPSARGSDGGSRPNTDPPPRS